MRKIILLFMSVLVYCIFFSSCVIGTELVASVINSAIEKKELAKAEADEYKGFQYEIYGDGVIITGYRSPEPESTVIFPSHIKGKSVLKIGNGQALYFSYKQDVQSIYIPNTVKKIGANAFFEMLSLQTVVLPDGLEEISAMLFYRSPIKYVTIPNSVKYIRERAFAESDIEYLILPDSIVSIGEHAFSGSKLEEIMISQKVKQINFGSAGFYPCRFLSEASRDRLREVGYRGSF